jgi:Na+-transporting NADH:ubiquinone oxidoreductase subunit NqrB
LTQWLFSLTLHQRQKTLELSTKISDQKPAQTTLKTKDILISGLRSSLITALGLSLLLRTNHPGVLMLAGCLAIASKFLLRYQDKHFFNPANFGIISVLLLTNNAWVSPGQWGTDWWYLLLFFSAAGLILNKVGRWDTSIAFLASYGGLEILRNFWLGWSWDVVAHQLTSGSLLIFAFFMVTDPRSIPNAKKGRIFWAISIALLTFILQHGIYSSTAIFWALFILSPSTIIIDKIWKASRFNWQQESIQLLQIDITLANNPLNVV